MVREGEKEDRIEERMRRTLDEKKARGFRGTSEVRLYRCGTWFFISRVIVVSQDILNDFNIK